MSTCWDAPLTNMFLRRWRRRKQAVLLRQDSSQALSLPHRVPIPSLTWPARSGRTHSSSSGKRRRRKKEKY
uniref:CWC25 spliceosome associated protein-like protein n=1 Tax=Molossus molossus TaxID=27622 RepID=A0A7J8CX02_MOLMO|nr:CWC25 spliceosome associated protein-like protein [Molossus molossus]